MRDVDTQGKRQMQTISSENDENVENIQTQEWPKPIVQQASE